MTERTPEYDRRLNAALPKLRQQFRALVNNPTMVEDLLQETAARALNKSDQFQEGTNFEGWLYTIGRNFFYSTARKLSRNVEDPEGTFEDSLSSPPSQDDVMALNEALDAINRLPVHQRRAIRLVGIYGHSYDETAQMLNIPVGSVKSQVSRARATLVGTLIYNRLPSPELEETEPETLIEPAPPVTYDIHHPAVDMNGKRVKVYDHDRIAELARTLTDKQVATQVGCSHGLVYQIRQKRGIPKVGSWTRSSKVIPTPIIMDQPVSIPSPSADSKFDFDWRRPGINVQVRGPSLVVGADYDRKNIEQVIKVLTTLLRLVDR